MEESRSGGESGERETEREKEREGESVCVFFSFLEGWGRLPIHSVGFNRTYSCFIIIS